jgi:hypothetical protein
MRVEAVDGVEALTEVWLITYNRFGEKLEMLQLRRDFGDPSWDAWRSAAIEIVARGQQSLF